MAITKIHAIKATVHKTVAYICNPKKTDNEILVSSFGCAPKTADKDFQFALSKTNGSDPNLAFHLIQSFSPGEVSYDEAHKIGNELADKLLEGKYSYIVCTHIDHNHIHNHILFCAADNIEHKKYNDCKKSYYHIRNLSDELCKEHQLSIVIPGQNRGMKYNEWKASKEGSSYKAQLKSDIDNAILSANSYDDFIAIMRAKEYSIENEIIGDPNTKYIKFKPKGAERFIRGSAKSFGSDEYTKEGISKRIEDKVLEESREKTDTSTVQPASHFSDLFNLYNGEKKKKKFDPLKNYSSKKLIDTTGEKFANSPGLSHWAAIQNLKIAASTYSAAGSMSSLEKDISAKTAIAKDARRSVVDLEHSMKELGEIIRYAQQYKENQKYQYRYEKSKDKETYFRNHEYELTLYAGAENMLRHFGIDTNRMDLSKMKADFAEMTKEKADLQSQYKALEKDTKQLQKHLETLQQYLQKDTPEQAAEVERKHRE